MCRGVAKYFYGCLCKATSPRNLVIPLFSSILRVKWFNVGYHLESHQILAIMTQGVVSIHSLRLGEVFALALGLGFSTLAVSARVYTKSRITKTMGKEDCECAPLYEFHPSIF